MEVPFFSTLFSIFYHCQIEFCLIIAVFVAVSKLCFLSIRYILILGGRQKHLTQEKLAECLDVSSHYIYELERGVKTMSLYTLNDLSTCLEVSSDYLLYGKYNTDSNPIPEDALSVMIKDLPSQQRNRLADLLKVMMPYISLDESSQTSGNDAGTKKSK